MNNNPTHMYLFEFDANISQSSVEQQGLHMLSLNNDHYLVPVLESDAQNNGQVQILIDSTGGVQLTNQDTELTDYNEKKEFESNQPIISNLVTEAIDKGHQPEKKKLLQKYVHIPDRTAPARAEAVLPAALQLRRDASVRARRSVPAPARFGPVTGINHNVSEDILSDLTRQAADVKVPIFLIKNKNVTVHIDVSDKDKSNWLSLLPLGDQSKANVWLYQEDNELYAITVKPLVARSILYLGYSKQYAEDHNLPPNQPVIDLSEALSKKPKKWWCNECDCAQASAAQFQKHVDVCHNREKSKTRFKRYRCKHCTRTFTRLSALRRHIATHCRRKSKKTNIPVESVAIPDVGLNTTLSIEDNRIPSDESFQNYTNGLDFSTNLFDTDRMPNLDISGSSRSEVDFNPYSIGYKDDSSLNNDLDLSKATHDFIPRMEQKHEPEESFLSPCPYCNIDIAKDMKRQHVRKCPARKFECDCGIVFFDKEKLANHIYSEHPISVRKDETRQDGKTVPDRNDATYKCEQCELVFKRRGMLVNHLWRAHKAGAAAAAAAVPLARHERRFPCGACPKIYRTRAKRDRHVRAHHPGIKIDRVQSIIGGKRAYEPAVCIGCPRQYATRAKLLQHIRAHHPDLAPPKKKSLKELKRVMEVY